MPRFLTDFTELGLGINAIIFVAAAALVWYSGTRLTRTLDGITDRTGMDKAFAGMLFLGGATSMPEVAAVSTAAWTGNAPLATNNLLGSVAINVMLIAAADAALGRHALTSTVPTPATMLQGTLGMILLGITAAAILIGDTELYGTGIWPPVLAALCVGAFWLSSRYAQRAPWRVERRGRITSQVDDTPARRDQDPPELASLVTKALLAAGSILVAGFALSQSADAIAKTTGLGAGLVGLVLVGFATSLPELSSITEAVRRHRYEMALGDVFGTNLLTIALLLLVDAVYSGEPVLNTAGRFEAVAALLGAILTGIFVVGLLERQNKTILRMGYDAVLGICVFCIGLALLYRLQGQ